MGILKVIVIIAWLIITFYEMFFDKGNTFKTLHGYQIFAYCYAGLTILCCLALLL